MQPDTSHLHDHVRLKKWRRAVLKKGGDLALQLEKIMNGLDARLDNLGPGMPEYGEKTKRERLRRYLDQVDRVIKSFDTGKFGYCVECGAVLPELRLDEQPWTERCADCFTKALKEGRL